MACPKVEVPLHSLVGDLILLAVAWLITDLAYWESLSRRRYRGMAVRVVVAEPDRRARSALVALLAMEEGVAVAGEAATAAEVVVLCESLRPEVVLLADVLAAPACVSALRARSPATRILVLATYAGSARAAVASGADSSVLKDAGIQELSRAIRALAGGHDPADRRARDPGPAPGLWTDD